MSEPTRPNFGWFDIRLNSRLLVAVSATWFELTGAFTTQASDSRIGATAVFTMVDTHGLQTLPKMIINGR